MNYVKINNYTNIFVFDTKIKGPTITIFGGIHGDEIAGVKVIDTLFEKLKSDKLKLLKGKLIIAYGNEEAIKVNKRQIKFNLNRIFRDKYFKDRRKDYEINRVKELKEVLDTTDILLDIHSTPAKSVPFLFAEDFKNELNIAKVIGPKKIIVGWEKISGDLLSGDTNIYMHKLGKIAFTLESGEHKSKKGFEVAYSSSLKLLKYFGLIENDISLYLGNIDIINMYKIEITNTGKVKFNKNIDNFTKIKKGDLIGFDGSTKIIAKEDFIILLPNYGETTKGEEIFYFGKKLL